MRILIIRIDGIGDLICTTPLLQMLRAHYPNAHIDFLANLGPHDVLKYNPLIDRLDIDYRTKVSGSRWKGLAKFPARFLQWFRRRLQGYDLVVVAHYGLQSRAMQLGLGCKTPLILAHIENSYRTQFTDFRLKLTPFKPDLHEVEGVCAVLEPLGIQEKPSAMRLMVSPEIEARVFNSIHDNLKVDKISIVGLNLCASSQSRIWPETYFVQLILLLNQKQPQLRFLVNGLPKDLENFSRALQKNRISTCGRIDLHETPSLQELFACIKTCAVYVSSEGGAVHMAAALGVPQVALYQNMPMKLTRWYPWGAPCKLLTPPDGDESISEITPGQVAKAVEALLAERI